MIQKTLTKKSSRSEGKSLSMLAEVKFCILENNSVSNCIYYRAMFLVFYFLHFPCKLDLGEVTNWN